MPTARGTTSDMHPRFCAVSPVRHLFKHHKAGGKIFACADSCLRNAGNLHGFSNQRSPSGQTRPGVDRLRLSLQHSSGPSH